MSGRPLLQVSVDDLGSKPHSWEPRGFGRAGNARQRAPHGCGQALHWAGSRAPERHMAGAVFGDMALVASAAGDFYFFDCSIGNQQVSRRICVVIGSGASGPCRFQLILKIDCIKSKLLLMGAPLIFYV